MPGRLIAVVGPSGAGKDTIIDGARARLGDDARFVFPRRILTRPAGAAGEDHVAVTPEEFADMKAAGAFALDWHAHGISYAIPITVADDIAAGRTVIANLSRQSLAAARAKFPTTVVEITAPVAVLAERLAKRGRETAADIRERLDRADALPVAAEIVVVNDGPIEPAIEALMRVLQGDD